MKIHPRQGLERLAKFFHLESWMRFLMLCVLTGIAAGLVGVLFDSGLRQLYRLLFQDMCSCGSRNPGWCCAGRPYKPMPRFISANSHPMASSSSSNISWVPVPMRRTCIPTSLLTTRVAILRGWAAL